MRIQPMNQWLYPAHHSVSVVAKTTVFPKQATKWSEYNIEGH